MNIKSKQGLVLLDAMLADSTYNTHWSVFSNVFKGTDIDYINHSISTEINGVEVIDEYNDLLQDELFIEELDIIQNNINEFFR
jgi:hypothetical protein